MTADRHLEHAGLDDRVEVTVQHGQFLPAQREFHRSLLPRGQGDPPEAFQFPYRTHDTRLEIREVELHHLVAPPGAGIADVHPHLHGTVRRNAPRRDAQVAVREGRVGQSESEGEHRLFAAQVPVVARSSARFRVVDERELGRRPRQRERQAAARADSPGQHVGNGVASLLARVPGVQDRRHLVDPTAHGHRAAGHENDDDGRARGGNVQDQLLLHAGQIEAGTIPSLAFRLEAVARDEDRDVRTGRSPDGLLDALRVVAARVASPRVADGQPFSRAIAEPREGRDALRSRRAVRTEQALVRIGSQDGDGTNVATQRKEVVFILQENDRFLCRLEGQRAVGGAACHPGNLRGTCRRIVQDPGQGFHPEHVAHRGVDGLDRDATSRRQFDHLLETDEVG